MISLLYILYLYMFVLIFASISIQCTCVRIISLQNFAFSPTGLEMDWFWNTKLIKDISSRRPFSQKMPEGLILKCNIISLYSVGGSFRRRFSLCVSNILKVLCCVLNICAGKCTYPQGWQDTPHRCFQASLDPPLIYDQGSMIDEFMFIHCSQVFPG